MAVHNALQLADHVQRVPADEAGRQGQIGLASAAA